MQQGVALSSSEAEYVAISMCLTEMMFIYYTCTTMDIKIELPMTLYCDNTGAISLCENYSTTTRTHHIDIKWHYVRDIRANGKVIIAYINTKKNRADPMTKNVQVKTFKELSPHLVKGKPPD